MLDPSLPWTETLVVSHPEKIEVDVDDDLNRELALFVFPSSPLPTLLLTTHHPSHLQTHSYKQALHGASTARALAAQHNFPFTRPADFFAEMVKSDAHMQRVRQRLLDEQAGIKKSEDARRAREGKKFGKQVQQEKVRERERARKEMEDRVRGLKRSA